MFLSFEGRKLNFLKSMVWLLRTGEEEGVITVFFFSQRFYLFFREGEGKREEEKH